MLHLSRQRAGGSSPPDTSFIWPLAGSTSRHCVKPKGAVRQIPHNWQSAESCRERSAHHDGVEQVVDYGRRHQEALLPEHLLSLQRRLHIACSTASLLRHCSNLQNSCSPRAGVLHAAHSLSAASAQISTSLSQAALPFRAEVCTITQWIAHWPLQQRPRKRANVSGQEDVGLGTQWSETAQ